MLTNPGHYELMLTSYWLNNSYLSEETKLHKKY